MTTLVLTQGDILNDIAGFNDRIRIAQERLATLPSSPSTYKERKKLDGQRRKLQQEITHVQGLISLAEEAAGFYVRSVSI